MRQERSYGRVLAVSVLVGYLEVALTVVVVLLYVRTQPPPDTPPDWGRIAAALLSLAGLTGVIGFLLSLLFVLPAVALSDLLGRRLGERAAWCCLPLLVAALLAPPVWVFASYNDAQTRPVLLFWASATASLSAGALAARPRGQGLARRVALWGGALVAGTGLFGTLGLVTGALPPYEPPVIGPAALAGTWSDHTGNTLTFTADGRVTASGVAEHSPGGTWGGVPPGCSGTGTWSYEPGRDPWSQRVRVDVPGCGWPAWGVGGTGRAPRIHQSVGAPGSGQRYQLRKATSASPR
ncbi:hypothetical protein EF912_16400 [Streptomyces sp. WAC07061]|uniref:hypothetical protein n=1 Tax=Streptomyces sp. WAC07061 TaxID=2487410 RepID=UPI000F77EAD9|nr:hypothetical protein [Streptomyces sp. WAC07061]RSS54609.1 hypothetical protein EF912_16400 [Streptomyces sp. WAC07061]